MTHCCCDLLSYLNELRVVLFSIQLLLRQLMELLVVVELRLSEILAAILEELVRVDVVYASLQILCTYLAVFVDINHV